MRKGVCSGQGLCPSGVSLRVPARVGRLLLQQGLVVVVGVLLPPFMLMLLLLLLLWRLPHLGGGDRLNVSSLVCQCSCPSAEGLIFSTMTP